MSKKKSRDFAVFCGLIEYYIADRLTILGDFFFDGITSNIGKYKQELFHRHTSKNIHRNAYHDCVELRPRRGYMYQ